MLEKINRIIPETLTYCGTSMYPFLRESDILRIYSGSEYIPSKGDIILFEHPENKKNIVHRIIGIEGGRIYTKGDSSREQDPWSLKPSEIKGVVAHIWRNNKTIHILSRGNQKSWPSVKVRSLSNLAWRLYYYLRPLYRTSLVTGLFYNFIPNGIKPRPFIFTSGRVFKLYLLINKTRVARYDRTAKKWIIKPPFRFFINRECMDNASRNFEKYLSTF